MNPNILSRDTTEIEGHAEGRFNGKNWKIINSDALNAMQLLDEKSVDCIVTSPPYFWLRDYGIQGQLGLEENIDEYVSRIVEYSEEMYRILKDDGVYFLNLGDTYYSGRGESKGVDAKSSKRRFGLRAVDKSGGMGKGIRSKSAIGIPWRVAIALSENGWILRSPIIWNRVKSLPEAVKDRPRRQYEYIFMLVKSRKYKYNSEVLEIIGENDIWDISVKSSDSAAETKSAPFPKELADRCIRIGSQEGDTILDPFSGSGTTIRSALNLSRNAIGIELSADIFKYSVSSIKNL